MGTLYVVGGRDDLSTADVAQRQEWQIVQSWFNLRDFVP